MGYELDLVKGFVMGLGLWVGFRLVLGWVDVGCSGVRGLWLGVGTGQAGRVWG